uniref:Signal-induced proliferation-associated 1-like protein C-terminal domain-containing protein n=1 Tax=Podarcis muralis TaxID=64176 RepID=A0A670IST2_PODMU
MGVVVQLGTHRLRTAALKEESEGVRRVIQPNPVLCGRWRALLSAPLLCSLPLQGLGRVLQDEHPGGQGGAGEPASGLPALLPQQLRLAVEQLCHPRLLAAEPRPVPVPDQDPKAELRDPLPRAPAPAWQEASELPRDPPALSSSQPGAERILSYRQPSGSFSMPGSSGAAAGAAYARYKPSTESSTHRYAAPQAQRPLMPFDPLYAHEAASNGDSCSSSGGVASQESTMERPKPEPLWHVPAQPRVSAPSGSKRPSRQELAGKDSPNRHSKGEGQYSSSHSSSNTLSSNASSSHSDERWFDTPDPAEADPDPLAKGGSSDSGIDATSAKSSSRRDKPANKAPPPFGGALHEAAASGKRRDASPAVGSGGQSWGYHGPKAFGVGSGGAARGGSGNHHFKQPSSGRATYPAQAYKAPPADATRGPHMPQSSSFQLSASVPKSFFSKQGSRNKHLPAGWKRGEETPARPTAFADPKKQVDLNTKNVFGQPRLRASLRDLRSPRKTYKSTIEDDLKKLIIMDGGSTEQERDLSPQKTLQRTLSDESLCSGRRDPSYASAYGFEQPLPGDVLFTSTFSTLPVRKQHPTPSNGGLSERKGAISASELSLTDVREKPLRRIDPGLMPLPDTAAGLEWSSLVNAAKAYEVQRAVSLFSLHDATLSPDVPSAHSPVLGHLSLERQLTPRTTPTMRRSKTRWSCRRRWPTCATTTSACRRSPRRPTSSCGSLPRSSPAPWRRRSCELAGERGCLEARDEGLAGGVGPQQRPGQPPSFFLGEQGHLSSRPPACPLPSLAPGVALRAQGTSCRRCTLRCFLGRLPRELRYGHLGSPTLSRVGGRRCPRRLRPSWIATRGRLGA